MNTMVAGKKICIIGTGGSARDTLTCLADIIAVSEEGKNIEDVAVFMEEDDAYTVSSMMGIPVIKFSQFTPEKYQVIVAIGNPVTRKTVVEKLPPETEFITLIHPTAIISKWVEIGEGSVLTAGVILTCNIKLGKHSQLNLQTTITHDCILGDYFTTAPAVNISGNCEFGECVYFGTNASVRQGVKIVDNVTIGMGGVVIKDIIQEGVYIGNPVQLLKKE